MGLPPHELNHMSTKMKPAGPSEMSSHSTVISGKKLFVKLSGSNVDGLLHCATEPELGHTH